MREGAGKELRKLLDEYAIRITSIEIQNLRNVKTGHLEMPVHNPNSSASITGIYGQNGSGKTSVISAVHMIKVLLSGGRLDQEICRQINIESQWTGLKFTFEWIDHNSESKARILYSCEIGTREEDDEIYPVVFDETIKASSSIEGLTCKLQDVLSTAGNAVLSPKRKAIRMIGKTALNSTELIVEREMARRDSRSFLFSKWLRAKMNTNETVDEEGGNQLVDCDPAQYQETSFFKEVFNRLVQYTRKELHVLTTAHNGMLTPDFIPVQMNRQGCSMVIPVGLNGSFEIPLSAAGFEEEAIKNLNCVLESVVPGLTISMKVLDIHLNQDGQEVKQVQLVSHKNQKEIPFQYESEGIRKIISVLPLLIGVYNQPQMTAVIDELDSGIFEYLLGELLQILQEEGRGQLIFTAHNLRPLEVLSSKSIVFTTTNPENSFVRMQNIKSDNNLRNVYYRDIVINEQKEELYRASNTAAIAHAFKKAGKGLMKRAEIWNGDSPEVTRNLAR